MATSTPRSPPSPRRSLGGLGRGALFSVWTLPCGRWRRPAARRPPLVFGWSRVGLGGRGLSLRKLLFFLPTTDSVWLLFFLGLQRGHRRLSTRPLTNLRIAGFSQFRGSAVHLHRFTCSCSQGRRKSVHTWGFPLLLDHLGILG